MREDIKAKEVLHEKIKAIQDKFPNTIEGGEYVNDGKDEYTLVIQQDDINGTLTFQDKQTYESFVCLIECLNACGLQKPTNFTLFNDIIKLVAKKFPKMQATPYNVQKIAFAASLILSATQETKNLIN
jgi:hypothetical protein